MKFGNPLVSSAGREVAREILREAARGPPSLGGNARRQIDRSERKRERGVCRTMVRGKEGWGTTGVVRRS